MTRRRAKGFFTRLASTASEEEAPGLSPGLRGEATEFRDADSGFVFRNIRPRCVTRAG